MGSELTKQNKLVIVVRSGHIDHMVDQYHRCLNKELHPGEHDPQEYRRTLGAKCMKEMLVNSEMRGLLALRSDIFDDDSVEPIAIKIVSN